MQVLSAPVIKDVVLVGAGHAHVAVLKMFGMNPLPGVRLTLITREVDTPYSGMLPGLVAGHYTFDEAHIDAGPLARFARARLYRAEAIGLDLENRHIVCRDRPPVPYDVLSLDIGSRPNTSSVPGAEGAAIPVKPIDGFLPRFEAMRRAVIEARGKARVALVGAGAAGVELILAVERRLRRDVAGAGGDPAALSFLLVTGAAHILPAFPAKFRALFESVLAARGVAVRASARVSSLDGGLLRVTGGESIAADHVLWTTEATAASWLGETGLALDERGFIRVDESLRALGHDAVFAAGDTAAFGPRPLPRSGVYAVRAGPVLAANIRAVLTGARPRAFAPQREVLYLVSTADGHAVGTRNGFTFSGRWVWRWKNSIDRRFMAKYNALPEMPTAPTMASPLADKSAVAAISAIAMRCGGCGAKVGASVLSRALGRLEPLRRADVVVGLDAPDDAAIVDTGGERLSVHSVDYFRAIVDDPYVFGKIAANHALGDLFAMGAEPQTALAIATVPYGLERQVEADLSAMMTGANEVLVEAGCALAGGHTSEGAELSLGFAVNGLVAREAALRKSGMVPGDALVLTKPVGTGTLLAADMRGKSKARWTFAALDHMIQSNGLAAKIIAAHGAHAATDLTGFGLLGHLVEMTRASNVDATLALGAIPMLEGARETLAAGIFSSLQPENVRLRRAIRNLDAASRAPLYPLLFDPQTAGGLLASVPVARAAACVRALRLAGYASAAIIGRIQPRSDELEPITVMESLDFVFPVDVEDNAQAVARFTRGHTEGEPVHGSGHRHSQLSHGQVE